MRLGLEGVHVLLTGASGGIGQVTAQKFLDEGATVSMHYFTNLSMVEPLLKTHPDRCMALQADVRSEESVQHMIDAAVARFGPIKVLVLNHGISPNNVTPVVDMDFATFDLTVSVNLRGSFVVAKHFLRQAREHHLVDPSVVIVGSTAAVFGEARNADYAATKSALQCGFMRSLKNEIVAFAPGRVNAVQPGWVDTPMAAAAKENPQILYRALGTMPLNKIAQPADVANAILFLASPLVSGHTTGGVVEVTGGMEGRVLNMPPAAH
eukprot:GAFH01004120.1.p1 GENE.GAFH01004120.1~~GAFH01004120.1.p1  ORF type:complete len:266 (-),score=47.15 GAFH01004120.1:25-822(-)